MIARSQSDARFQSLLTDFDRQALENDEGTIYGLWPSFALAFVNVGWFRFAEFNNGEPGISSKWRIGASILDGIAEPLRGFFAEHFERCLRERRPWEHVYECSSAEKFRLFHMTTFPLGNAEGLLVVNSLRQEVAHTSVGCPPLDELYRNEHGIVTQCGHCRRVRRRQEDNETWDWVPAWVTSPPPNTSHGLCEPCVGFHYSSQRIKDVGFDDMFDTDS